MKRELGRLGPQKWNSQTNQKASAQYNIHGQGNMVPFQSWPGLDVAGHLSNLQYVCDVCAGTFWRRIPCPLMNLTHQTWGHDTAEASLFDWAIESAAMAQAGRVWKTTSFQLLLVLHSRCWGMLGLWTPQTS